MVDLNATRVVKKTPGSDASVRARTLTSGTVEVAPVPETPAELPRELARQFDVVARLGGGAQGVVLRVRPKGATRDYALKFVAADEAADAAAREERLSSLEPHENVVAPLQVGRAGGQRYVVYELVEGQSLEQWLREQGRLAPAAVVEVAYQLLRALAHIHALGVVHRDVKPGNVLVSAAGLVRLTDFGLATTVGADPGGLIMGTPRYLSPEQIRAEPAHPGSDIYAFGCVLHHLSTGDAPFDGETIVDTISRHLQEAATPASQLADVPEPLAAFILRCLEKPLAARPADGARALSQLAWAARASGLPEPVLLEARPVSRPIVRPRAVEPGRRRAARALPFAAGALALFVSGTWLGIAGWSWILVWPALGTSGLLVAGALAAWASATLGRADAWLRVWADGDALRVSGPALAAASAAWVLLGIVLFLLFPYGGAGLNLSLLVALLALSGVPALQRGAGALAEDAEPPPVDAGPMDLSLHFSEPDWEFSLEPAGHGGHLPGRVSLARGLNRLTVWRAGRAKRTFLLWGQGPLVMYAAKLEDAEDGPALAPLSRGRPAGAASRSGPAPSASGTR